MRRDPENPERFEQEALRLTRERLHEFVNSDPTSTYTVVGVRLKSTYPDTVIAVATRDKDSVMDADEDDFVIGGADEYSLWDTEEFGSAEDVALFVFIWVDGG